MKYALALTLLLVLAFGAGLASAPPSARSVLQHSDGVAVFNGPTLPALEFVDEKGDSANTRDLQGRWTLVFFGYTFCPDVCPMTLLQLSQLWKQLSDEQTRQLTALLVSVDPQRDTPAALKPYMNYFNPEFRAFTGNPENMQTLTGVLNAFYARVERPDTGDYLMDHSANLILIDPQGRYRGYIEPPFTPVRMKPLVTALLNGGAD